MYKYTTEDVINFEGTIRDLIQHLYDNYPMNHIIKFHGADIERELTEDEIKHLEEIQAKDREIKELKERARVLEETYSQALEEWRNGRK